MILQKVKSSEKVVRMIESDNIVAFETDKKSTKDEIAKEVENLFKVKVEGVRTLIRSNKKFAYVKLTKDFAAADVASKLGVL